MSIEAGGLFTSKIIKSQTIFIPFGLLKVSDIISCYDLVYKVKKSCILIPKDLIHSNSKKKNYKIIVKLEAVLFRAQVSTRCGVDWWALE